MSFRTLTPKSSSLRVPPDTGAVSSARRRVVAIVRDWDLPLADDTVESLELLAGEVIANAVVHTGEGCRVTVSWDGARVRLEAEDTEGGLLPQWAPAGPDEESGRGLRLVDGLAQAWGFRPTTDGKAVWFEVDSHPPSRPSPAPCQSDSSFGGAQRPVTVAEPGYGVLSGFRVPLTDTRPPDSGRTCSEIRRRRLQPGRLQPSGRRRHNQGAGDRLASVNTERDKAMPEQNTTTNSVQEEGYGLLVARRRIAAARSRAEQSSDGGSTGRSDSND